MNAQRTNRRVRPEFVWTRRVMIEVIVEGVILVGFLLWLVNQAHKIPVENRLDSNRNELGDNKAGDVLGRKGRLGTSDPAEKTMDLDGAKEDAKDDENDDSNAAAGEEETDQSYDEETYADEYLRDKTEEEDLSELRRANVSTVNQGQEVNSVNRSNGGEEVEVQNRSEVGSLVYNLGAVILKSVEKKCEVFQVDETGVSEHDSADSVLKEGNSSSENDCIELEAYQKFCVQRILKQQRVCLTAEVEPVQMTEVEPVTESMFEDFLFRLRFFFRVN